MRVSCVSVGGSADLSHRPVNTPQIDVEGSIARALLLLGLLLLQMAGNLVTLLFAEKIVSWISPAIFKVVMRIFGLLLCGLAVQLVIFGLQVLKVIPGTPD